MIIPDNLLFTKDHEWVKLEGDMATVGITDYAQSSLGDITFIDLPKVGASLRQSGILATVESVKAASDVYAPLSGEVTKVNQKLVNQPELVNKSSYQDGWFAVIKVLDMKEKDSLMDTGKYREYVESLSK